MPRIEVKDLSGAKEMSLEDMENIFGGAGWSWGRSAPRPPYGPPRGGPPRYDPGKQAAKNALQQSIMRLNAQRQMVGARINYLNNAIRSLQGQRQMAVGQYQGLSMGINILQNQLRALG